MKKSTLSMIVVMFIASIFIAYGQNDSEQKTMKAKQIPLEDFFKNPEKSSYQISPNGDYFS